jgi:outer membrane lipoprotein-sorting protein
LKAIIIDQSIIFTTKLGEYIRKTMKFHQSHPLVTRYLARMSPLPALIKVFKPGFIGRLIYTPVTAMQPGTDRKWLRLSSVIVSVGVLSGLLIDNQAQAAQATAFPDAMVVINKINQVDDGEHVTRNLTMTMVDKRGKIRVRETQAFRKYYEGEKRTILFYKKPTNVKGTAFLTFDYQEVERDDDQWLYLPGLRKVRRISASDRGDYFLGTDFTYEDIKLEGKIEVSDYDFEVIKSETLTLESGLSYQTLLVKGIPKSQVIAKELGYGRIEFSVDSETWLIIKANYWDPKGKLLKTLVNEDIRPIDGILTRHKLTLDNHKTGHQTTLTFSKVDYKKSVKDSLFSKRAMKQGK